MVLFFLPVLNVEAYGNVQHDSLGNPQTSRCLQEEGVKRGKGPRK